MSSLPSLPATLDTLPPELLLHTASMLPQKALQSLSLVSRQLHLVAQAILFATLTLTPDPSSLRAFNTLSEEGPASLRDQVRSIHLVALYESPHFRPIDLSRPVRTLITGRPALAYPSSLDTLLDALPSTAQLLRAFPNLMQFDITTISPPSNLSKPLATLGLPVRALDLTGADLSLFPVWFFDALGNELERVIIRPPPVRFVGPVDLLGRRRQRGVIEAGGGGDGLMRALWRSRKTIRDLDLSGLKGVPMGIDDSLVFPRLSSLNLASTIVHDPAAPIGRHADTLRHLTIDLSLPDRFPSLPALQSLAIQRTKERPGLTFSDALDFLHSAESWGSSLTDLDLCFTQFNVDVLNGISRAFPNVQRLVLRGAESSSPYGVEMVGSLVSQPSLAASLSTFRHLASLSLLGTSLAWPRLPYDPMKERTVRAYADAIPRLEDMSWSADPSVGSRLAGPVERWGVLRDVGGEVEVVKRR